MPRSWRVIAGCALAVVLGLPALGQDSPSLGDLARQAQKDKANQATVAGKPSTKVLTNDDMPSGSNGGSSAFAGGLGDSAQPAVSGKVGAASTPSEQLARLESFLDQIESMDRETMVRSVLRGQDVDFPGRAKWEERLVAAQQSYVSQGRELILKARQIIASADNLKGVQDPNDPRVKEMHARLQELMREAVKTGSTLQSVVMEGRDLAAQASAH